VVQNSKEGLSLNKDMFGGDDPKNSQRNISVNLKNAKDLEFIRDKVLPNVDVVLESYRPGTMEKLGLGTKEVHSVNPSVIYGRLSGYG
jgi:crotonobetainyl-CoA:carnitine CoA-transferase CaiB-like acyl-CoA transferase